VIATAKRSTCIASSRHGTARTMPRPDMATTYIQLLWQQGDTEHLGWCGYDGRRQHAPQAGSRPPQHA
jgi:hypothetical protein